MNPRRRIPQLFFLVLMLGVLLPALPLEAVLQSAWLPPLNLSNSSGRSTFPAIASADAAGTLLVVWSDYTDDARGEVLGRQRRGGSESWDEVVNLSLSSAADEGHVLYADEKGDVHLAWTRRQVDTGTDLLYRRWSSGSWSPPEILDHNSVYNPAPYSLFFVEDVSSTLWLFVNIAAVVRYTRLQDGQWEELSTRVHVPRMRRMGAIVGGPEGRFHVVALGENEDAPSGCDPWLDDAYYATTDGVSWDPLVNMTYQGTIAYDVDLAFDSTGALHLMWSDIHPACSVDSIKSAVYERVLAGGSWGERQEVTDDNADQAMEDIALATDKASRLYLAWIEGLFDEDGRATELSARYRPWREGEWGGEEIVWASSEDTINVDIALYQGIVPVMVWEEGPTTAEEVSFSQRGELVQVFVPLLYR